jgi:hypothetical protein
MHYTLRFHQPASAKGCRRRLYTAARQHLLPLRCRRLVVLKPIASYIYSRTIILRRAPAFLFPCLVAPWFELRVFYVYIITKVHGYAYTIKKFGDTCVPSHELSFTCVEFRPPSGRN